MWARIVGPAEMGVTFETANGMPDAIKWLVAVILIGAAVGAFYFYAEESLLLRVVGLLVVAGVAGAIALQTEKGRAVWALAREARTEVRKVVWPTRKETVQTTMIVVVFVILVALMLWGLDSFLGWLVSLAIG